ncbi:uncharacterized protein LOC144135552 [Amblyomma americanum]
MPTWSTLFYGQERLGHQPNVYDFEDRANRLIAILCGVCTAVTLAGLVVFMAIISFAGSRPPPPPVSRRPVPRMVPHKRATTTERESDAPIEEDTTHPLYRRPALYATQRPRRRRCQGPRMVGCSGSLNVTSGLVRHHAWFFVPNARMVGGGSCLEWIQGHMCHDYSLNRFRSQSECREACQSGVPRSSCTRALDWRAVFDCPHAAQADMVAARKQAGKNRTRHDPKVAPLHWWFYDPVQHACRTWTDVCVFKSYATMAECARACIFQ